MLERQAWAGSGGDARDRRTAGALRAVPLADALTVLLPDARDVALLRCLFAGRDEGGRRWAEWQSANPDMRGLLAVDRPDLRALLPTLDGCLSDNAVIVSEDLRQLLRAATLWETQRLRRIEEILETVLVALESVGVAPILLGGLAVALTGFPRPSRRHCHDVDLLIDETVVPRATAALIDAGFRRDPRRGAATLVHRDGLPIRLRGQLLISPFYALPEAAMRRRTVAVDFAGRSLRTLRPSDAFLHVLARVAAGTGGAAAQWATDAMMILRATPPVADEWRDIVAATSGGRLALPLAVLLAGLHDLGADIPDDIRRQIAEAAARSKRGEREAALFLAVETRHASLVQMIARSSWHARLLILRWTLMPMRSGPTAWRGRRHRVWTYAMRRLREFALGTQGVPAARWGASDADATRGAIDASGTTGNTT